MEILIGIAVLAVLVYVYTRFFAKPSDQDGVKPIVVPPTRPVDEVKVEVASVEVVTMAEPAKKAPKSPAKAEVAEKRTRKGGKFVGDDKSTPGVNEAFKGGKAPAKKAKPKKPKMTVVK